MRVVITLMLAAFVASGCSDAPQQAPEQAPNDTAEKAVEAVVSEPAVPETSEEEPTGPKSEWEVIEAFEVGRDIYVRSLALDEKRNSLWVGTSTGVHEVNLADQNLRNTFTRADGLANEYVFAMYVDQGGDKWFGTNGGGMSRYRDGEWRVFFPMHGLADYWVYSFGQQAAGDLWIGTWAGVNRWNPKTETMQTYVAELINEWVYGIGVDSKDRVWFATEGGVSMYDGDKWRAWTHKDGLGAKNDRNLPISFNTGLGTRSRHDLSLSPEGEDTFNPNYIFSIHVSRTKAGEDLIWAGTWGGGVSYFDGQKWNNYTSIDGLAGDVVYSISEGRDGTMWFGTNKGVSQFDGENWYSFGRRDGILGEHVYAIAALPNDEVWVGSRGGVTRLGKGGGQNQNTDKAE